MDLKENITPSKEKAIDHAKPRSWFAIYTRPRHEKKVHDQIAEKGIETYLPLRKIRKQWSDRKKWTEEPLFRSYVFFHADAEERYRAVQSYGAVRVVSFQGKPAIVRDEEIERIKRILAEFPDAESGPKLGPGDRVEIMSGPLAGMQGILQDVQGEKRLLVAIESIRQGIRFNVDARNVKKL
jgi:transcription antitermination factor NusG